MNEILTKKIHRAASLLKTGAVLVYPTETVYGIGCDPLNAAACERIRSMKGRDGNKPMLLLASSLNQLERFAGKLDAPVKKLAKIFWPGPLTMIIKPSKQLPSYLYGPSGGVAFRVTPYPEACLLAEAFDSPVISTSANISGEPPVSGFSDAMSVFGDSADMVIENETPMGGIASTLLDVASSKALIIREGAIQSERIEEVLLDVFGY